MSINMMLGELEEKILALLYMHKAVLQRVLIEKRLFDEGYNKRYGCRRVFSVVLQRSLNRLCGLGLLIKVDKGHQKVFYRLTKKGLKEAKKLNLKYKILSISEKLDVEQTEMWVKLGEGLASCFIDKIVKPYLIYLQARAIAEDPQFIRFHIHGGGANELKNYIKLGLAYMTAEIAMEDPKLLANIPNKDITLKFRIAEDQVQKLLAEIEAENRSPILPLPQLPRY